MTTKPEPTMEKMRIGPGLTGRIAHMPSASGRSTKRVAVHLVEQVAREGLDGSGYFKVTGDILYAGNNERRGHYYGGGLGSQTVDVEQADADGANSDDREGPWATTSTT